MKVIFCQNIRWILCTRALCSKKLFLALTLIAVGGLLGNLAPWHPTTKWFSRVCTRIWTRTFDDGPIALSQMKNFEFLHNPSEVCISRFVETSAGNNTIIAVVQSSRDNFTSRQIIRRTYGSVSHFNGWYVQVVFTVGLSPPGERPMIQEILDKEIKHYGDIIMGNFDDTERNSTMKHLMGFKWVNENCESARFYINARDDTIIEIFDIIEYLSKNTSHTTSQNFYCKLIQNATVVRGPGKFSVSPEEFPGNIFPDYCGGGVYLTRVETTKKILIASKNVTFLFIDDVLFMTGIMRERINGNDTLADKKINIIPATLHDSANKDKALGESLIQKKNLLGVSDESRTASTSCLIWHSILKAHEVEQIYVSLCGSLL